MSLPDKKQLDFKEDSIEILRGLSSWRILLLPLYFGAPPLLVFLIVGTCAHRTGFWTSTLAAGVLVEFTVMLVWAPTVAALVNSRNAIAWFSQDAIPGGALSLREVPTEELS